MWTLSYASVTICSKITTIASYIRTVNVTPIVKVKLYTCKISNHIKIIDNVLQCGVLTLWKILPTLQCWATKYILHDRGYNIPLQNTSNKTSTTPFHVCFRNIWYHFFITHIKNPTSSFNITSHVSFSNSCTRSNGLKLSHNTSFNNKQRHFYFNRICRLPVELFTNY